ncbi:hypothetical protein [Gordonia amicalis]|uniref:hypothetical protein n=1 Tax=Gordonia amicalis TaxID=89053 RepID=UPI0024BA1070|nr:hypothetical protein [Gordonia amicalis]MDJ0455474.1 hypothetical protein [Gordonia amicalis]MDV7078939.1 hypothetical protein [Gordonia amicalis]MDV7171925.1 hypothetical protein [Gordonia amicalis]
MINTRHHSDRIRAVRRNLDALNGLGVLSDKESATVSALVEQAHRVEAFAANSEAVAAQIAQNEVAALIDKGKPVDDATVAQLASKLFDPRAIDHVAEAVYAQSATAAWNRLLAKRDQLPAILNARFDEIRTQAEVLEPKVRPLEDASAAIRAGLATEWAAVEDLAAERAELLTAIRELRRDRLLFEPKRDTGGYLLAKHPHGAMGSATMPPHRKFFAEALGRVDWVPCNEAEIDEVRAADEKAEPHVR